MPRIRSKNAPQHVSDSDEGRIVAYMYCGLSYRCIAARTGRDLRSVNYLDPIIVLGRSYGTPCWISTAPYQKQPRKPACYPHDFNGSSSQIRSLKSRIGVLCKTTSVFTNISMTFEVA
ncbi:hypothetical protein TNCV_2581161 [Trichonephila clavipes]|nr:hypothetical protein TNCV_2581161 [Trichonephila clavipes]